MTEDDQRNLGLELHCVEGDMCSYNRCVARELGSVEAAIEDPHQPCPPQEDLPF
jgi:hypothetical protein